MSKRRSDQEADQTVPEAGPTEISTVRFAWSSSAGPESVLNRSVDNDLQIDEPL